jgi:hypothetical protein
MEVDQRHAARAPMSSTTAVGQLGDLGARQRAIVEWDIIMYKFC